MSEEQPQLSVLRDASVKDWLMLAALIFIGGSAFVCIKAAVQTAEPAVVSGVRLWVAALLLCGYAYASGRPLPGLLTVKDGKRQLDRRWRFMLAGGLIGYTIPFTLFPLAQQTVDSMLAGIYMAFMPLLTIVMAYFFAREPLTLSRITGFSLGTIGVIFLIGPAALQGIGSSDVTAQLWLIIANVCYAIYAVMMRWAPEMPARTFAAGTLLSSAIFATPLLLISGQDWTATDSTSWLAMIYLGIMPSGIAAIVIINLIRKNGAGFMAMANYVTPVVAIVMGMLIYAEPLKPTFLIGLLAILAGLAISRSRHLLGPGMGLQKLIRPRK
ncbi:DMT family transporter [Parvularcula sp. IMCC14364]|uniref:DMT family transporter n=1 Tax=Parvularcula sp. IMCC14364 TaxID=3067902 RepID=UPI002741E165|nr:DMT family transporter [Parvularcula sp. IMCC14364]